MRTKTPTLPDGSDGSSTDLSSRLVRLAHANPEYRQEMRSVLDVIAAKEKNDGAGEGLEKRRSEQKEFIKLLSYGPRFGVVSAHQGSSDSKNKIRRAQLIADLTRLGYRKVSPMRGKWSLLPEDAFLIQNVRPDDLFELGRKYKQDFVVFSNEPGVLGFYNTKGDPKARVIVDPTGDTTFRSLTDMTPYSRSQGLDVEFGLLWSKEFPWDGRSAFNRKQVRRMLKRDGLKEVTP